MTRSTFWANLTPAQQNRLYRLRCKKCKRSLRRAMVDECKCDTVGNATDALKASAYPHINTIRNCAAAVSESNRGRHRSTTPKGLHT